MEGIGLADPAFPETEHDAMLHRYRRSPGSFPPARRLQHRTADATVLDGLGFKTTDFERPTETFSGRMADAHRAGETAPRPAQICCCSTSRPTISTSKRATG
jgi:hypothetical protein